MMVHSDSALQELVSKWSDCSLPARDFTHPAHLAVCTSLLWNNTLAGAYALMKAGLYRFNEATGTPNTEDRGYHETLTRFWCTLLFYRIHRGHYRSCLAAVNALVELYGNDSRADRPYYSFDVLSSKEARARWIPPDRLAAIPLEAFRW
jgi:hypothetical protein